MDNYTFPLIIDVHFYKYYKDDDIENELYLIYC